VFRHEHGAGNVLVQVAVHPEAANVVGDSLLLEQGAEHGRLALAPFRDTAVEQPFAVVVDVRGKRCNESRVRGVVVQVKELQRHVWHEVVVAVHAQLDGVTGKWHVVGVDKVRGDVAEVQHPYPCVALMRPLAAQRCCLVCPRDDEQIKAGVDLPPEAVQAVVVEQPQPFVGQVLVGENRVDAYSGVVHDSFTFCARSLSLTGTTQ
jgi:hypothetical protein